MHTYSLFSKANYSNRIVLLSTAFIFSALLASCGGERQGTNTGVSDSAVITNNSTGGDPVSELKPFIEERNLKISDGGVWEHDDSLGNREISGVSLETGFDVKQTDSLVSPYVGTVNYEVSYLLEMTGKKEAAKTRCRENYAYQDSKWTIKSQEFVAIPEIDSNDWETYTGNGGLAAIVCGFADA